MATIQHLKVQRTKIQNTKYAHTSDTPVTLNQSQGHQTWKDNVIPSKIMIMQSLKDLANVKFSSEKESCQLSPLNMYENQKWKYIHDLLHVINNCTQFQLKRIRT